MKRKALLVGINDYRGVSDLRGCINDVTNMGLVLEDFAGFGIDEIRIILDLQATKEEIVKGLHWLTADAESGDFLLFHFSGHGSQIRDRGEQDEFRDGLDELICPHDMDWNGTFLTDDELLQHLRIPKGVTLEVILDCCHSGDGVTVVGMPETQPQPSASDPLRRFLQPPAEIISRHADRQLGQTRRLFRTPREGQMVLWAGCADYQTATDALINENYWGAFTFYMCKHIRESEGRIPRNELLHRVQQSLQQAGYDQIPELILEPDVGSSAGLAVPFASNGD